MPLIYEQLEKSNVRTVKFLVSQHKTLGFDHKLLNLTISFLNEIQSCFIIKNSQNQLKKSNINIKSLHKDNIYFPKQQIYNFTLCFLYKLQIQMLQNQFQSQFNVDNLQWGNPNERTRQYAIKLRQKKVQIQDYDLKQKIGEGGFGVVKKAVHKLTGQLVAVKIIKFDRFNNEQIEGITREIQLHKTLIHEHIAKIYQVIKKENKIYIVMEYCKNGQLFNRIDKNGHLNEKQASRIFHQILSALIYINQNGYSHRDIKPENILFDQNWSTKIIDFGFSCTNNGDLRRTVCGTPSYTPPQIFKRQTYDAQLVDVWSLGVTLYVMLSAQMPFTTQNNDQRKSKVISYRCKFQPGFSSKAQKLLSSIFVQARYRPHLKDLLTTQFALSYSSGTANCINLKNESIVLQESLVKIIDSNYKMDSKKVAQSVKQCKLDKYHALYYLALKHERQNLKKNNELKTLNQFKKQRKSSNFKLQPIYGCFLVPKQQKTMKRQNTGLMTVDPNLRYDKQKNLQVHISIKPNLNTRLRNNSPDSPRRLLDCLGAYKYS